jgi:hypothetical protein
MKPKTLPITNTSYSQRKKNMPLELPTSKFNNWKKQSANYYYPKNADGDNHIHVACEKIDENKQTATIKSVSIKIAGKSTNLRPKTAVHGFKFDPAGATFPADPTGAEYKQALQNAGVI